MPRLTIASSNHTTPERLVPSKVYLLPSWNLVPGLEFSSMVGSLMPLDVVSLWRSQQPSSPSA